MAGTGPNHLISPTSSQMGDEEILMAQLRDTINSSAEPAQSFDTPKRKKRKSHHKVDAEHEDRDENAPRRKKKTAHSKKRDSRAPEPLQDVDTSMINTSTIYNSMIDASEIDGDHPAELTSKSQSIQSHDEPKIESIIKPPVRRPDKASALMMSILKDCTPDRGNQRQFKNLTSPIIMAEDDTLVTRSQSEAVGMESNKKASNKAPTPRFPLGYVPGPQEVKARFQCPVIGCAKKYSRRRATLDHLNAFHGSQKLIDNEDGTMTAVVLDQSPHRGSSVIDSNENDLTVKGEVEERKDRLKKVPHKSTITDAMIRSISSSRIVPPLQATRKPAAHKPDPSGDMNVKEDLSMAAKISTNPEKIKVRQLADHFNGAQPDHATELYIHGAETIMDSWEVKPGVIRASRRLGGEGFEVAQDIAFSSAYIGSESSGVQLPGMNFQLCRLTAGNNRVWASEPNCNRLCSVASGKVRVSVGQKEFSIGAHGMWRIPSGVSCTTTNHCYAEAVLHVCTTTEPTN